MVVEVLVRGGGNGDTQGKRRGVERALEGWRRMKGGAGPCDLLTLDSLKAILGRSLVHDQVYAAQNF